MDDFYNGPIVSVWVAFAITVLMLMLGLVCLKEVVRLSRRVELRTLGLAMAAIALLWMPTWFIYGLVTSKFR